MLFRHFEPGDLDDLFALYRDPEVRQYFPEGILTREETKDELKWFMQGHPKDHRLGLWATISKPTLQFIGRCGLLPFTFDGRPEVEVSYLLAKKFWGQGLGTEAARAIMEYGFEELQLERLICLIEREYIASIKVATNIGMGFEQEGSDEKGSFLLYSRSSGWVSNPMMPIRTCARAIIIRDRKILTVKYADDGGEYYALPGGKQLHGESLSETLFRECQEELDVTLQKYALRFIQEYIGKLGESSWRDADVHQIEFIYECELTDGDEPHPGFHGDQDQVDIAWLSIDSIKKDRFYPKKLIEYLGKQLPSCIEYWGIAEA